MSQVEITLAISSVAFNPEERETSGLTRHHISHEKRDFGSRPEFTLNPKVRTSYLPVVISPRSKRVPIPVGAVMDTGGYLGTPIPIIKYSNPSSYGRIPTRKSCRY